MGPERANTALWKGVCKKVTPDSRIVVNPLSKTRSSQIQDDERDFTEDPAFDSQEFARIWSLTAIRGLITIRESGVLDNPRPRIFSNPKNRGHECVYV